MLQLVTLAILFSVTNAAIIENKCFCEQRRNIKIAKCQSSLGLTHIPANIDEDIKELHFEGQLLSGLDEKNFKNFETLSALYLQNNEIEHVNEGCLKNLTELETLDLSTNMIKKLPRIFGDTPKITIIYLNNNKLHIIHNNLFSNLHKLEKLNLQNNNIMSIGENCFSNLPSIYEINLSSNMIDTLPTTLVDNLTNLKVLDLENNPWTCDSRTCKFREYSLKKNWKISMPPCNAPENVKGKTWKQVQSETMTIKINKDKVRNGDNIILTCEFTSCVQYELVWKTKENEVLPYETRYSANQSISILKLDNFVTSEEHTYICSIKGCHDCYGKQIHFSESKIDWALLYLYWIPMGVGVVMLLISLYLRYYSPKSSNVNTELAENGQQTLCPPDEMDKWRKAELTESGQQTLFPSNEINKLQKEHEYSTLIKLPVEEDSKYNMFE